jgi:hypothetical protein
MEDQNAIGAADHAEAALVTRALARDEMTIEGRYHVECVGPDGEVKWVEDFDNLITDIGKKRMLDLYLDRGTAETRSSWGSRARARRLRPTR